MLLRYGVARTVVIDSALHRNDTIGVPHRHNGRARFNRTVVNEREKRLIDPADNFLPISNPYHLDLLSYMTPMASLRPGRPQAAYVLRRCCCKCSCTC